MERGPRKENSSFPSKSAVYETTTTRPALRACQSKLPTASPKGHIPPPTQPGKGNGLVGVGGRERDLSDTRISLSSLTMDLQAPDTDIAVGCLWRFDRDVYTYIVQGGRGWTISAIQLC
ncbi:hypothetical protein TNIN_19011 [Trichonephila inaurata madagascariensis]|uniref:Uncharacterized protein n=1 Tax=Trichonephila inaurata madagascariensis TaxID=2747483 RepID=A0A8X6YHV7_9ARAC|nr:hypothetical protein TNIN_19011 [Trichonephila inaurata madagascariensis]